MTKGAEATDTEAAENELGSVLQFMRLLWSIDHALQRASKRMAVNLGITGPQRLVIRIVGRFPGISAGRLSTVLHMHPSTLTGILERLVDAGLVKRAVDRWDRRRAVLSLTAKGRRIEGRASGTVEQAVERVLRNLSPADRACAELVLGDLARELSRRWPHAERTRTQHRRTPR